MRKFIYILLILLPFGGVAQNINENFEKIPIVDRRINISSLALSPDQQQLAIGCGGKAPLYIYDWQNRQLIKEIDVKSSLVGYKIYYSAKGNYLLLQEQRLEYNPNKAREVHYTVVEVASGQVLHQFPRIHDAKITADEKSIVTLENEKVIFRDLKSGAVTQRFAVEEATNAMAISPDGKQVVVSHRPDVKDLKEVPSLRADKKALKPALKFRQMLSVFDAESGEKQYVVNEVYDIVNQLYYTEDGSKILCYGIPHTKYNSVGFQGYVNVIDATDGSPLREAYLTRSSMQPDFGYDEKNRFFGIASVEKFPTVNIYEVGSGSIYDSFDTQIKIGKARKEGEYAGSTASYVFLPGSRKVMIGFGNRLILWKLQK